MKKALVVIFSVTVLYAAPSASLTDPFLGEWQGSAGEYDINILFLYSSMCVITVKNAQDGKEITEKANGTWSCDSDIIRIDGSFPNSKIKGLNRINWTSVYVFNNNEKTSFNMLERPPGGSTKTRMTFNRIMRWIDE